MKDRTEEQESRKISRLVLRHGMAECRARQRLGRAAGLDARGALALDHLLSAGRLTSAQLGSRLMLGAAETAEVVEMLEADGFLRRCAEPDRIDLAATPLGHATLSAAGAAVPAIDPAAAAVLGRFIDRLVEATERETERLATISPLEHRT